MDTESVAVAVVGGFNIIVPLGLHYTLPHRARASKWELVMMFNRIITYSHVFKTINDYCGTGDWLIRIRFYEQRDNPIDMYTKILTNRRLVLLSSNPPPPRLLSKIVHNPRFSNASLLFTRIEDEKEVPEWVYELEKVASRLYLELSPIMYARGFGRLVGIRVSRARGEKGIKVNLCINKDIGIGQKIREGGLEVVLTSISKCLEE